MEQMTLDSILMLFLLLSPPAMKGWTAFIVIELNWIIICNIVTASFANLQIRKIRKQNEAEKNDLFM